jgi:hypothetical protein
MSHNKGNGNNGNHRENTGNRGSENAGLAIARSAGRLWHRLRMSTVLDVVAHGSPSVMPLRGCRCADAALPMLVCRLAAGPNAVVWLILPSTLGRRTESFQYSDGE